MMAFTRRRLMLIGAAALGGCSVLPTRPYQERREWPLDIPPPAPSAARGHGVLLVRSLGAGPGLDTRGLRTVDASGAENIAFWEEWAVPPPQGVGADLRAWLAASGLFRAVVTPGSEAAADFILEGQLLALSAQPGAGTARAVVSLVLLRAPRDLPVMQRSFTGTARLQGVDGPALASGMRAAVGDMLGQVVAAVGGYV